MLKFTFTNENKRYHTHTHAWIETLNNYHPSRKPGSLLGGAAAYCGGAITGGP
jgi:hypothetical protein